MISEIHEIRNAYYSNLNAIGYYLLLLYQFINMGQKKNFSSFLTENIQKFLGIKSHNLVCVMAEDTKWYKRLFGKVVSFFSMEFWLMLEIFLIVDFFQYNTSYTKVFGDAFGTGYNYFGVLYICALLCVICCCVVGINPLKHMDWIAPSYPLALIFGKLACFCAGCCWGVMWEGGMYNYRNERYEVPVQLIEAIWALLIFIFMMLYKKKAKRGTLFPIYMILYCATRFCSEFFRRERDMYGPFKVYHVLCASGIVVGIVLLIIVKLFGNKIDAHFDKNYRGVIGFIVRKIKGVNDDGTYTEKGAVRAERRSKIVNAIKKKIEAYKKKRAIRKRKGQIKF